MPDFKDKFPILDQQGLADFPNDFLLETLRSQFAIEAWQPARDKPVILCLDDEGGVSYVIELRAPTAEEQQQMQAHADQLEAEQE